MPTVEDDERWLGEFARGDNTAFTKLVTKHGPLVWGVCRRAIAQHTLAEEAFQAVFLVLARRRKTLPYRTTLANWLYGVAVKVSRKALNKELRVKQIERLAAAKRPVDGTAPEADRSSPEWNDILRVLDEELGRLSERWRAPLVACYLQGKTQDEAATELGWSIHKLRRRLAKARDLLRLRMSRRGATFFASLFAGAIFASVGFAAALPNGLAQQTVATVAPGAVVPVAILQLAILGTGWPVPVALALLILSVPLVTSTFPERLKPKLEIGRMATPAEYDWVTLRGQIVWPKNLDIPAPAMLNVTTDRASCCANDSPLLSNQLIIDPKTRGIRNVVVWLMPEPGATRRVHPKSTDSPLTLHEIDQPECQFEPRVIAARVGDSLLVKNSANIAHNVQVMGAGLEYNRTLPASKSEEKGPLTGEAKPITIVCNVHPWMKASLWVFDHPHFAVTDAEGRFEIPNVPVGSQRLVIWHELGYDGGPSGKNGVILTVDGTDPVYGWPTWALQLGK